MQICAIIRYWLAIFLILSIQFCYCIYKSNITHDLNFSYMKILILVKWAEFIIPSIIIIITYPWLSSFLFALYPFHQMQNPFLSSGECLISITKGQLVSHLKITNISQGFLSWMYTSLVQLRTECSEVVCMLISSINLFTYWCSTFCRFPSTPEAIQPSSLQRLVRKVTPIIPFLQLFPRNLSFHTCSLSAHYFSYHPTTT